MSETIRRTVAFYSKEDETLAGEYPVSGPDAATLRALFDAAPEDPMLGAFPIDRRHAEAFERWTGRAFDFQKFDYFLECSATPLPGTGRET